MSDYHTVYKDVNAVETEWDVLQRKHGNLPPAEEKPAIPAWEPAHDVSGKMTRDDLDAIDSIDELDDLDDEFEDDRFMEEYRRKRMQELEQECSQRTGEGVLKHIRGSEFVKEVTEASEGSWVVCHLYKDGVTDCAILNQCLAELAGRYKQSIWIKIVSTECIPGFSDEFLPTILLYKDKKCKHQMVQAVQAMGGHSINPERLKAYLNGFSADEICKD